MAPGRKKCIEDSIWPLKPVIVGFQETKQSSFSRNFLNTVMGNRNFDWNLLPSVGSVGGILVGVDIDQFEVLAWEIKKFSVSVVVKNRSDDLVSRVTTVYGPTYEVDKQDFISELHSLFLNWEGPAIVGGDFNLVRTPEDKNDGNIDFRWSDRFNSWVDMWYLLEINMSGRNYTWCNN